MRNSVFRCPIHSGCTVSMVLESNDVDEPALAAPGWLYDRLNKLDDGHHLKELSHHTEFPDLQPAVNMTEHQEIVALLEDIADGQRWFPLRRRKR